MLGKSWKEKIIKITFIVAIVFLTILIGFALYSQKTKNGLFMENQNPNEELLTQKLDDEVISGQIDKSNSDENDSMSSIKSTLNIGLKNNVLALNSTSNDIVPYKVNYKEKGTNKVLSRAKTGTAGVGQTITAESEVIDINGYEFDSVDKDYITIEESGNEFTIYYVKQSNLSYRVNFKDKETGATLRTSKVVNNVEFESIIESDDEVVSIDGYTYDSAEEDFITITTGRNIVTLYYLKNRNQTYTVYYKETGTNQTLHTPRTIVGQKFGTVIRSESEVIDIEGYNYDYPNKYTLEIGSNNDENTIIIFYSKVTGISFKVNYLDKDTEEPVAPSHKEGGMTYGDIIEAVDYKVSVDGYNYDSSDKDTITIAEDESKNVINIYYKKRNDLSYKVNYQEKDTNQVLSPSKTITNQTFGDEIQARNQVIAIDGYNYYNSDKDSIKITTGNNEITLYYVKKNDLTYTVNYKELGTNAVLKAQKLGTNKELGSQVVATNEIVNILGYEYKTADKNVLPITTGENELTLYYTKRNDLEYIVKYLEKDTNRVVRPQKVKDEAVYGQKIYASNEVIDIDGYDFYTSDKDSISIKIEDNVITLYYKKKTNLSYRVNYLEKDTEQILKAQKVKTGKSYEDEVTATSEIVSIPGYDYDSSDKDILVIGTGTNEITLYYTKKTDLSYKVNYLEKDTLNQLKTPKTTNNVTLGTIINATEQVVQISGYRYDSADVDRLEIKPNDNIINLYYTKRNDLSYTVNYKEARTNATLQPAKVNNGQTFGKEILTANEIIDIEGYNYDYSDKQNIIIGEDTNEITLYYSKVKGLNFRINYLDKDTGESIVPTHKEGDMTYGDKVEAEDYRVNIDGYLFDSVDKDEITIVENEKQNVINIYYKKRNNLSYRVNYLEKDTNRSLRDQKVQPGNSYADLINSRNEIVPIDGYIFDSISSEQLKILANENTNVINIFYVKRNDLGYTVKYLEKDTNRELHRAKNETGKKFQDIVKASDEIIPIDGYNYSSTNYEQMVIGTGDNTLILYYKKRNDLQYKVNYLEKDTNKVLKTQKVQRGMTLGQTVDTNNEIVTIDGYEYNMADNSSIQITTGENVINLYYTKRRDLSYKVNFLEKGSNTPLAEPNIKTGITYGDRINAKSEIIQIDGYNYDSIDKDFLDITTGENLINIYYSKRNDLAYKINYLEKDTNEILRTLKRQDGMLFGDKVYATDEVISIDGYSFVEADKEEITIGTLESKNVINLYYKKITGLPYIVNYIDKDTRREIKDSKIAGERTFGDVIRTQDEIIKIYGYDYDSADKQLLTISTGENVINLFYTKKDAEVEVHYYEERSTTKVAPDKIINGKVGDSYRTSEPNTIDDKYELVEVPENRVGTMTEEPIEVFYFYRKKATTVTVHYYEEGTTNKVSENVVIEGRVDDPYVTKPAMDVPIKYELSIVPENNEGTMTLQPIEVIYYYRVKDAQVNIKYVDKATGAEITEQDVLKGKVDDEYQTTPKDIMNFTLIEHSGNETGRYEVEPITVTYYYLQKTRATVQYVDKTTGLVIEESTQEGLEGDWFETTSRNLDGYVLVEEPEVKKVQMTKDHIILKYYYIHISAGVIEKHVDMISGEILENTVHEGKVGDQYEVYSKVFEGYDLVEEHLPQNSKGIMGLDAIEVVYYYKHKAQVTVQYIDKVTGQEIEVPTVILGHEAESYTTEAKDLPDYVLDGVPENATGEMTIDPIEVIYYYKHTSGGVKVNYIDIKTGEKLADEIVFTGCESDPYKAEEKFFDGFDIVMERYPQNTEGTMTIDPIEVTYYYVKKSQVTVKYIDRETGREINDRTIIPGHEGEPYTTEAKVISGYDLMEEPKDKSGNIPRDPLEIVYYYARPAVVVVNYIDEDTNEKLADEIVINGHDGDEYKTEQKKIQYYKFDKTSGNEKGKMKVAVTKLDNGKDQVNDVTEVTYYYKKMKFNMKVDKMIGDIILDGSVKTVNGKIGKAEIYRKNLGKSNLRISYKIKVENTGEIAGKATVIENIPAGMTVNSSSNAKWQLGNNIAKLETEELKPGEFREYIIVLDWTKGESNLGTKDNTAEIIKTSNEAGFADVDTSDNKDKASVIITVGTGEHAYILITATAMIVLLGAGYVIYKKTKK